MRRTRRPGCGTGGLYSARSDARAEDSVKTPPWTGGRNRRGWRGRLGSLSLVMAVGLVGLGGAAAQAPTPSRFFQLYLNDAATPCGQGTQPPTLNQSGIVFFPGSMPLYKNGQLVGGLGISGDGVEQDDLVAAAGATGFATPLEIRADRVFVGGIRLPLLKFPRNPLAR